MTVENKILTKFEKFPGNRTILLNGSIAKNLLFLVGFKQFLKIRWKFKF